MSTTFPDLPVRVSSGLSLDYLLSSRVVFVHDEGQVRNPADSSKERTEPPHSLLPPNPARLFFPFPSGSTGCWVVLRGTSIKTRLSLNLVVTILQPSSFRQGRVASRFKLAALVNSLKGAPPTLEANSLFSLFFFPRRVTLLPAGGQPPRPAAATLLHKP